MKHLKELLFYTVMVVGTVLGFEHAFYKNGSFDQNAAILYYNFIRNNDTNDNYLGDFDITLVNCLQNNCSSPTYVEKPQACQCNSDCIEYGDCCPDAQVLRNETFRLSYPTFSCVKDVFIKMTCPPDWDDDNIRVLCENQDIEMFFNLPASNNETGITYRNIYCAICNSDHNVQFWRANASCQDEVQNETQAVESCDLQFVPPEGWVTSRDCDADPIGKCSPHWINEHLEESLTSKIIEMCHLIFAPVAERWTAQYYNPGYKNVFCAICNDNEPDDLECRSDRSRIKMITTYHTLSGFHPSNTVHSNYMILFDVDFFRGGRMLGSKTRCPRHYLYDPFNKTCRLVFKSSMEGNSNDTGEGFGNFTHQENFTIYWKFPDSHTYITLATVIVSLLCLLLKMSIFLGGLEKKRLSAVIVFCLALSLFCAQTLFVVNTTGKYSYGVCATLAAMMHYFFLCMFFWTSVLAFDLWRTFNYLDAEKKGKKYLVLYSLCGWLPPLLFILTGLFIEWSNSESILSPYYGAGVCWINNRVALLAFFVGPVGLILIANGYFLMLTVRNIFKSEHTLATSARNTKRNRGLSAFLYTKLVLILGMTWVCGFLAAFVEKEALWVAFILLNGLQGVYILIAFTPLRTWLKLKIICSNNAKLISSHSKTWTPSATESTGSRRDSNAVK